jgi:hypothetical protein
MWSLYKPSSFDFVPNVKNYFILSMVSGYVATKVTVHSKERTLMQPQFIRVYCSAVMG